MNTTTTENQTSDQTIEKLSNNNVIETQQEEEPGVSPVPAEEVSEKSRWWKREWKKKKKKSAPAESGTVGISSAHNVRTPLHGIVNDVWGKHWIDDPAYSVISQYANPHSAYRTSTGFEMKLNNGMKFCYTEQNQYRGPERIFCKGSRKKFNQETAAIIVVMSRLYGWKKLNLHGSVAEREMLWLAVQRQNMADALAYEAQVEQGLRDGTLQKVGDPERIVYKQNQAEYPAYIPLEVNGFEPIKGSRVLKQWADDVEEYRKKYSAPEQKQPESDTKKPPVSDTTGLSEKHLKSNFLDDKSFRPDTGMEDKKHVPRIKLDKPLPL